MFPPVKVMPMGPSSNDYYENSLHQGQMIVYVFSSGAFNCMNLSKIYESNLQKHILYHNL